MQEYNIVVEKSLDPQAVSMIVQTANKYKSHISLVVGDKRANAKSIMGLISLFAIMNGPLTIIADGEDEQEAAAALKELFGG